MGPPSNTHQQERVAQVKRLQEKQDERSRLQYHEMSEIVSVSARPPPDGETARRRGEFHFRPGTNERAESPLYIIVCNVYRRPRFFHVHPCRLDHFSTSQRTSCNLTQFFFLIFSQQQGKAWFKRLEKSVAMTERERWRNFTRGRTTPLTVFFIILKF